mmetsp:Transcript_30973/g.38247  ORF Transcript_30973/g.38247 Transcript_30973/m.38247 type:complete len:350 (+) Transcript_30973:338-1387(+)
MITAINPASNVYEESHNSLKYADRAKQIKIEMKNGNPRGQLDDNEDDRLLVLEAENKELRKRLSRASICPTSSQMESKSPMTMSMISEKKIPKKKRRISNEPGTQSSNTFPATRSKRKSSICSQSEQVIPMNIVEMVSKSELEHLKIENQTLALLASKAITNRGLENFITEEDIVGAVKATVLEVMAMESTARETLIQETMQQVKAREEAENRIGTQPRLISSSRRQSHIQPPTQTRRSRRKRGEVKEKENSSAAENNNSIRTNHKRSPAFVRAMEYASYKFKSSPQPQIDRHNNYDDDDDMKFDAEKYQYLQTGQPIQQQNARMQSRRSQRSYVSRRMQTYFSKPVEN